MADNITIKEAVAAGTMRLKKCNIDNADYDSFALFSDITGIDKTYYFMHGDEPVSPKNMQVFDEYISRRCSHEPLQYILGKAWFYGREYAVNENVLIPRADTEVLAEQAIKYAGSIAADKAVVTVSDSGSADENIKMHILDMCTGSGCIAITLALETAESHVVAVDLSGEALNVAKENRDKLGAENVSFVQSNLFDELAEYRTGQFDIIVSNPPYIETDVIETLSEEVREFEPAMALDGTKDGLYFYRRITEEAVHFLKNGGYLMYEIGYNQGEAVRKIMQAAGFEEIDVIKDYAGLDRVVKGRLQQGVL